MQRNATLVASWTWVLAIAIFVLSCTTTVRKKHKIGIVCGADVFMPVVNGFKGKMAQLGYVEGETVEYKLFRFNDKPRACFLAAKNLVEEQCDLVFTVSTGAAVAAKKALSASGIPLVFAYAGLEEVGLVKSVTEPGGNITGIRYPGPDQSAKRLELMRELLPAAKRICLVFDPKYPNSGPALEMLRPLAAKIGFTLLEVPVGSLGEMKNALASLERNAPSSLDGVFLMPDLLNHRPAGFRQIMEFSDRHRIPVGGTLSSTVSGGAVFGNASVPEYVGADAAYIVDKIFSGIKPSKIPVVTPMQELHVNVTKAKELGIKIPQGILNRADKTIR